MDIWTTVAKFNAIIFLVIIAFPIVAAPLIYVGMAIAAAFSGARRAAERQGTDWQESRVPVQG